jgi:hypothetical protein
MLQLNLAAHMFSVNWQKMTLNKGYAMQMGMIAKNQNL